MSDNDSKLLAVAMAGTRRGQLAVLKDAISDNRISLEYETPFGTLLGTAAGAGQIEAVRYLVEKGANINSESGPGSSSPLDAACAAGHFEVAEYLLRHGASLELKRPDNNPLLSAIQKGHLAIVRMLIDAGIDIHWTYKSESGPIKNALVFAREWGQIEIAELLEKTGCKVPAGYKDLTSPSEQSAGDTHQSIIAEFEKHFGSSEPLSIQEIMPVHPEISIRIHAIRPQGKHNYVTLFTTGVSDLPMTVPDDLAEFQYGELAIHLPPDWPVESLLGSDDRFTWPVKWLRKIGYHPHLANDFLGAPHTMFFDREPPIPLAPNTDQTTLLVSTDIQEWSPAIEKNGTALKVYQLVALYTSERNAEREHGLEYLLDRFIAMGTNVVFDPLRKPVI